MAEQVIVRLDPAIMAKQHAQLLRLTDSRYVPWWDEIVRQLEALDPQDPNYAQKAAGLRLKLATGKSAGQIAEATLARLPRAVVRR